MRKLIFIFCLITAAQAAQGQTKKAFREAAEKALIQENYYAALTYFNEVLEFDSNDRDALKKSAYAARMFNAYDIAAKRYTHILDSLKDNSDSTMVYYAADMYRRMGRYDKATEYYDRFISEYGSDSDKLTQRAKREKDASVWASSKIKEVDPYVKIKMKEGEINSENSDFGAIYKDKDIWFSSMRFPEADPTEKPPRKLSKIMAASEDSVGVLKNVLNERNISVANGVYNYNRSRFYYTVCDYINEHDLRCDIFMSEVRKDGTIENERKLPATINDTSYTSTQPCIVKDENSENQILYFSSNRPGGKGGMDIWYSIFDPKLGFSRPVNISAINTEEDEISPFYHVPTNTLYFSSDGRLGLGGFDVYQSVFNGGVYSEPMAMPPPTNSSYHDIYYHLNDAGDKALFSSNREGAAYVDIKLKACCFDIFEADIIPLEIDLNALTFDKSNGDSLVDATVQLIDVNLQEVVEEITNPETNDHRFKILRNKNYMLIGMKEGYNPDTAYLSTLNNESTEEIIKKLYLQPSNVILDVFTFDAKSKEKLIGTTVILEDMSDPTALQVIKFNESNNDFQFVLDSDKTYKITAKKNGYTNSVEIVDTRGISGKIRRNLYLEKFHLGLHLPIALYFDNDEPDPDAKSTDTDKFYGDLLDAYMLRKKRFMEVYGQGASKGNRQESVDRMEEFFEGNVKGGYDQFKLFMDAMIKELNNGRRINLTIRGYASPRFDYEYNLVLAQRRITSVRNEMERYADGVLAPYLSSKQLIITEISYGEELSPPEVNDNIHDEEESIYSFLASSQRKVEIINVVGN